MKKIGIIGAHLQMSAIQLLLSSIPQNVELIMVDDAKERELHELTKMLPQAEPFKIEKCELEPTMSKRAERRLQERKSKKRKK